MKIQYICEVCGAAYDTEKAALNCEKSHERAYKELLDAHECVIFQKSGGILSPNNNNIGGWPDDEMVWAIYANSVVARAAINKMYNIPGTNPIFRDPAEASAKWRVWDNKEDGYTPIHWTDFAAAFEIGFQAHELGLKK